MKFNLNDYKGKYAMHCKTKEEAEGFCRFLHQNGRKWRNGYSYLEEDYWNDYERDPVYCFNEGSYCNIKYTKWIQGYKILEWSDFMEDEDTVSKFTLDELKPGDDDLIYTREEEMTLDEVCRALGRNIKIVAEHQSN